MRQPSNPRRPRTRGNGKRHPSTKNYSVESNGPDIKIRGTAQQVMDKYLALARDAALSGDRVAAESYFQYADHYHRIVHSFDNGPDNQRRGREDRPPMSPDGPQPDVSEFPEASVTGDNLSTRERSDDDDDGNDDDDSETEDERDAEGAPV
jgi:hypothetical protein